MQLLFSKQAAPEAVEGLTERRTLVHPMRHDLRIRFARLVRGSSRRITFMRFRPAHIRVINRRSYSLDCPPRCLPTAQPSLPRGRGKPGEKQNRHPAVDRSLHIRDGVFLCTWNLAHEEAAGSASKGNSADAPHIAPSTCVELLTVQRTDLVSDPTSHRETDDTAAVAPAFEIAGAAFPAPPACISRLVPRYQTTFRATRSNSSGYGVARFIATPGGVPP